MRKIKTVFIRHGESQWNKENRFTGWVDIDLSEKGYSEARKAGKLLKNNKFIFDYGYSSILKRSIHTLWVILDELNQAWLPIKKVWQLNERHYGILQGLNKDEAINKYGYDTIQKWRRSFKAIPPTNEKEINTRLNIKNIFYNKIKIPDIPIGESLELVSNRVIPYWEQDIVPFIKKRNTVIIAAHGNTIRAIIKFLNNLNESEILQVEVPTGVPLVYEFDVNFKLITNYYLY